MARGDAAKARVAYAQATRLNPGDSHAWANLGAAEMVLGNVVRGERAYQKALQLDGDNWLARYNLGTHLARSGQRQEALEQLSRAVSILRRRADADRLEDVQRDMVGNSAFAHLRSDSRFQNLVGP